ncbi:hypothetical protein L6R50_02315 [Myxococcota bacterium]|nr:hypothetical protein [Myxococcota bacterium]
MLDAAPPSPEPAVWIDPAAVVHLSTEGLEAMARAVAGLLPPSVTATGLAGELSCGEGEEMTYAADDVVVELEVTAADLLPSPERLDLLLTLTLRSAPSSLVAEGTCAGFVLDETCTLEVQPTRFDAAVGLGLGVDAATGSLSATVLDVTLAAGSFGNPLDTGCLLGDALEVLAGWGVDPVSSLLSGVLEEQEATLAAQLEAALAEALAALQPPSLSVDLNGTRVDLEMAFSAAEVDGQGLALSLAARASTPETSPCAGVATAYAPVATEVPPLDGWIPGGLSSYHAAVLLRRDLPNQIGWALWQGGALCLTLSDLSGIPLTTDTLALFVPEIAGIHDAQASPAAVAVGAGRAPTVTFPGGAMALALDDLSVSLVGGVQGRAARIVGFAGRAEAGLDLVLHGGELVPILDLDPLSDVALDVSYAELVDEDGALAFLAALPDLVSALLDPASLLPTLPLPAAYGVSVASLRTEGADDSGEWLGLYADLGAAAEPVTVDPIDLSGLGCEGGGEVPMPSCEAGCGDAGAGCDPEACGGDTCAGGTCSASHAGARDGIGGAAGRAFGVGLLLVLGGLRRGRTRRGDAVSG